MIYQVMDLMLRYQVMVLIWLENQLNSNPTIDFTASNFESMRVTGGILGSDTYNDMWIYVVSKTDLNLESNHVL